jgi:arabinan endo-1,5-alpha-L-arabinosidase
MSIVAEAIVLGLLLCSQAHPFSSAGGILSGGADPTIVAVQDGQAGYYVVATGRGIPLLYSADLKDWRRIGRVFAEDVPAWAKAEVPASDGIWAPDLSFHDGLYYLYYSVSSFGSQRSVIGLASNKSLDPQSPDYRWIDQGKVLESFPGKCDFNAIDPALYVDRDGRWYLFFGSFWTGIKMVALDPQTKKPAPDADIVAVAGRPRQPPHAVEAPFVIFRDGYYYLFVSWDHCCDGADSDYKVMVGRARAVSGPYTDVDGRAMLEGGGTLVLAGNERWRGPGHNSVLTTAAGQWLVHHTYDVQNLRAQRVLQIRPLTWSPDGWPRVGEPIFEPPVRPPRSVLKGE